MIIALAAVAALALVPADTDTTPVDATLIELFVNTDAGVPLCESYGTLTAAIDDLGLGYELEAIMVDVADAFLIVSVEGDSLRLTPEARDVFVDWLHAECS